MTKQLFKQFIDKGRVGKLRLGEVTGSFLLSSRGVRTGAGVAGWKGWIHERLRGLGTGRQAEQVERTIWRQELVNANRLNLRHTT